MRLFQNFDPVSRDLWSLPTPHNRSVLTQRLTLIYLPRQRLIVIIFIFLSIRWVSNPQPPAWKAGALPIELLVLVYIVSLSHPFKSFYLITCYIIHPLLKILPIFRNVREHKHFLQPIIKFFIHVEPLGFEPRTFSLQSCCTSACALAPCPEFLPTFFRSPTPAGTGGFFIPETFSRDSRTRTCGPLVPNQVIYQLIYISIHSKQKAPVCGGGFVLNLKNL